jgi:hypothetical protein
MGKANTSPQAIYSSTSISSMTQSVVIPCKVPGARKRMSVNVLRAGFAVAVLYGQKQAAR